MSSYVIGDVQGCYAELMKLLDKIAFNESSDQLYFVGDLVNRGPNSLDTLRFIANLKNTPCTVLGNHDLHCLAVFHGIRAHKKGDTLTQLLQAPDATRLMGWLIQQPLLLTLPTFDAVIVHAGIPPQWTFAQAKSYATEVESLLKSEDAILLLQNLFGNTPDTWQESLTGYDRFRYIINAFTRMRFCDQHGKLNLIDKGKPSTLSIDFAPWFSFNNSIKKDIFFGHWAALEGITGVNNRHATDTGCVWGHKLTAIRLEDKQPFQIDKTIR